MILNAKDLFELCDDMDKNCIDFAEWCMSNIKKYDEKYTWIKEDNCMPEELTMSDLLEIWKEKQYEQIAKK